jgi:hypothetical protein
MSYDGDRHETRRNATIAIGVAVAAFAGVGLLYWLFTSLTGPSLAVTPTALTTSVATTAPSAQPEPGATTEVSPPPIASWTPTSTFSLPPPEAPTMTAPPAESPAPAQPSAPPVTTQAPAPPPPAPAPPAPPTSQAPAPSVSNVNLTCSQEGRRVVAKLEFTTTTKIDVLLSAGGDVSQKSAGPGNVSMTNNGRGGDVCFARVGNQVVGPVPAT